MTAWAAGWHRCTACRELRPAGHLLEVQRRASPSYRRWVCRPSVRPACFTTVAPASVDAIAPAVGGIR